MNLHNPKELINYCTDELYFQEILCKKSINQTLKKKNNQFSIKQYSQAGSLVYLWLTTEHFGWCIIVGRK